MTSRGGDRLKDKVGEVDSETVEKFHANKAHWFNNWKRGNCVCACECVWAMVERCFSSDLPLTDPKPNKLFADWW